MKTPTSRADCQSGFTLLELLVVMVIMALSATAVLYVGQGSAESARARSFLISLEALLREARTSAVMSVRVTDVVIDVKHRQITLEGSDKILSIPKGMDLDATLADVAGEEIPVIRFYPSGGSTGGNLSFLFHGRSYGLRVNWLTGQTDAEGI